MIFLKFFKQQDWRYAIPCMVCLFLFHDFYRVIWPSEAAYQTQLAWSLVFATLFIIFYSLKFAGKYNNLFIDHLKLFFYFSYFTAAILSIDWGMRTVLVSSFPIFVFYLYLYTILIFYKKEMEAQGKSIKKSYWLTAVIVQTVFILSVIVWAITWRVEAEKQKFVAIEEQKKTSIAKKEAQEEKEKYEMCQEEHKQLLKQK